MKAGQWDPKLGKIVVNEVPTPAPGPSQFLVKMISASLCHSDFQSIELPHKEPITLGHEGLGKIVEMGSNAVGKGFQIGDIIGFLPIVDCCFECEGCQMHNLMCQKKTALLSGFDKPGFFAEYATVEWRSSIKLPETLDPRTSSPIFCAGFTAFNAVDSLELKPGQWLAIVGAGGLGQLGTQYAIAMGAKVLAVDINDGPLAVCQGQGALHVFNTRSDPDYVAKIKEVTGGGVHAAAIFSGSSAAFAATPSLIRVGGTMMVVGIPKDPFQVSALDLVLGKYKIRAENTGIPKRIQKAMDFTATHRICPEVELRGGLEELSTMVEDMRTGKALRRMVITFD